MATVMANMMMVEAAAAMSRAMLAAMSARLGVWLRASRFAVASLVVFLSICLVWCLWLLWLVAGLERHKTMTGPEGETLFQMEMLELPDGAYAWRARGRGLADFCRPHWPTIEEGEGGWIMFGPYKTKKAMERDARKLEEAFLAQFPDLEIKDAHDPSKLS